MSRADAIMPEVLAVLKDMASYLEKQDTTMDKASLSKPPKTGEGQKPIKGGVNGPFGPGTGFAKKEFVEVPKTSPINGTVTPEPEEATLLKESEEFEEQAEQESPEEENAEQEENPEEDYGGGDEDVKEIKSLLKSMVALLAKSQNKGATIDPNFIRKEVKKEADLMLRKMGFHPSTPDIRRIPNNVLGSDQTSDTIRKSEDSIGVLAGPVEQRQKEAFKIVDDLSNKSWREINEMRERLGGFNTFNR